MSPSIKKGKKEKVKAWIVLSEGKIEMNAMVAWNTKKLALEQKNRFFGMKYQKVVPYEITYQVSK